MRGLWIEKGVVSFRPDLDPPQAVGGEVPVRVQTVGVCATDLALAKGYMGFRGVPGHEFVGVALEGIHAGRSVVGEINAACGRCATCSGGNPRHCPNRSVLGIQGKSGAFAEVICLPECNLHVLPDGLDLGHATFVEPLAAAFEIPAVLAPSDFNLAHLERALVVGDGRLGLLCAQVLALTIPRVDVSGRHPERGSLLPSTCSYRTDLFGNGALPDQRWPLVVEATGRPELLQRVLGLVEPRGTLVLKTTAERCANLDLAPLVIDEITLMGSRCGPFEPALEALATGSISVGEMVHARYPLEEGAYAFERAARSGTLKVLVDVDQDQSVNSPEITR